MQRFLMTALTVLMLAACGGGDSNNTRTAPPPSAAMTITSANAPEAAAASYAAAQSSGDMSGLAGSTGVTGATVSAPPRLKAQLGGGAVAAAQQVPFGPTESACAVSGSITVSGDLANPLTLTAGDTIRADFDNCDDGVGEVVDGRLDFEVDAFSGDVLVGLYDLTMSMLLTDFQVTSATDVVTANGDATVRINSLQAPYVEATVSGAWITTDTNTTTDTLSDFLSAQTFDGGVIPSPWTHNASGTLDSSRLSGSVTYSTPVPFEGFDDGYPNAGELLVTGDSSSARLIAAANGVDVTIEVDSDGDGTVDDTIQTTWDELTGIM